VSRTGVSPFTEPPGNCGARAARWPRSGTPEVHLRSRPGASPCVG